MRVSAPLGAGCELPHPLNPPFPPPFPRKNVALAQAGAGTRKDATRLANPLVRIRIRGIIGFSGFRQRASLSGERLSIFGLADWAKRNPENPPNPINPDSDKDAQTSAMSSRFPRKPSPGGVMRGAFQDSMGPTHFSVGYPLRWNNASPTQCGCNGANAFQRWILLRCDLQRSQHLRAAMGPTPFSVGYMFCGGGAALGLLQWGQRLSALDTSKASERTEKPKTAVMGPTPFSVGYESSRGWGSGPITGCNGANAFQRWILAESESEVKE